MNYLLILELLSFEYVNCSLIHKLLSSTDVWYVNNSLTHCYCLFIHSN